MATGLSCSTKENSNFARLCRLLIDGGTDVLRGVFDSIHPPSSLHTVLHSPAVHSSLKWLRTKNILNKKQWDKLYPKVRSSLTSKSFDITLLFLLLRNICNLTPPASGWNDLPASSNITKEADLARIKWLRNELYGHVEETAIGYSEFEKYWKEISDVLVRLGGTSYKTDIERLKVESMDIEAEKFFIEAVEEWEQQEQTLKKKIDEGISKLDQGQETIKESQSTLQQGQETIKESQSTLQRGQETMKQSQLETSQSIKRIESKVEMVLNPGPRGQQSSFTDAQSDSLKESIKSNTECQANLMGLSDVTSAKTDQIFTNLTVYHDSKQVKVGLEKTRDRSKQLQVYSHRIGTRVKECKDIFLDAERENPKRLLLTGKPGIGKSLFCQKLIRDWACGELFENEENAKNLNIEFAYLLTFRQLSLLGDKKLNLRELLNCSNLLDEHSIIDDSLFEYLIANPSKVLIILDGYDEYSKQHREEIAGDFDQKYPNNTETNMSIPALCSKLIKGKILRGCVVITSSRPGEAEELRKVNFDRHVEIAGFSREQVIEFIEKYLSKTENEEIKNYVVEQIGKNDNLISFCHVPLLCFLLCRCLEWRIMNQSGKTDNLPSTTTDLYDEVVEVFVQNLHANLKYANISEDVIKTKVQDTLGKLAELAGSLSKKSKYIFDEEDMAKLNLSKAEIESLKVSGILHCIPGIRISALKTKDKYSFTHLTLQEYLAAVLFVKDNKMPKKEKTSGQTYVFMSGLLSKKKDEKSLNHMKKLMQNIEPGYCDNQINQLLTLECLHEYGDDELAKLTITNLFDKYCYSGGWIRFDGLTVVECRLICYLLYIITLVKEQHTNTPTQSFNVNSLFIGNSPSLTPSIIDSLCKSLVPLNVSTLGLFECELDDKCVEMICDSPLGNQLKHLYLQVNNITDKGVECICTLLSNDNCLVKRLNLKYNDKVTDKCREDLRNLWEGKLKKPGSKLCVEGVDRREEEEDKTNITDWHMEESPKNDYEDKIGKIMDEKVNESPKDPALDPPIKEDKRDYEQRTDDTKVRETIVSTMEPHEPKERIVELVSATFCPKPEMPDTVDPDDPFEDQEASVLQRDGSRKSTTSKISALSSVSAKFCPKPKMPDTVDPDLCAWGTFNEKGGRLTIKETGVSLYVPPMALPKQTVIYIGLMSSNGNYPQLRDEEALLSPVVVCGPDGLQFQKPVYLTVPHNAVMNENNCWKPQVQSCSTMEKEEGESKWTVMEGPGSEAPFSHMSDKSMQIMIEHFTNYAVVGVPNKETTATPQLEKTVLAFFTEPKIDLDCAVRVYCIPATDAAFKVVDINEKKINGLTSDTPKVLRVQNNNKKLQVKTVQLKEGWSAVTRKEKSIPFHDIWQHSRQPPNVSFIFERVSSHAFNFITVFEVKQEDSNYSVEVQVTSAITNERRLSYGYPSEASGFEIETQYQIPIGIRRKLCYLLDRDDDLNGSNWQLFAERLGCEISFIRWLKDNSKIKSPTDELIEWWEWSKAEEIPLQRLVEILKGMERSDAVDVLVNTEAI